jgi:hypothetical protein
MTTMRWMLGGALALAVTTAACGGHRGAACRDDADAKAAPAVAAPAPTAPTGT